MKIAKKSRTKKDCGKVLLLNKNELTAETGELNFIRLNKPF